jgi:RNA polymerase sigma-70 factor (ECF subfamily)
MVRAAGNTADPRSHQALTMLCTNYWYPIYLYIRWRGYDQDSAQDLTQGFFAILLEKDYLKQVDRERGKFRSFLLVSVKHFLANEWDKKQALKRGAGKVLSLDSAEERYRKEPTDYTTPEKLFNRRWAFIQLENALKRLREDMAASGLSGRFERLKGFLTVDGGDSSYRQAASDLGMNDSAVKVAVHRMRRRLGEYVRAEIAETVDAPDQAESEIRFLMETIAHRGSM